MIYLDNAATTLMKPIAVKKAVLKAMTIMSTPGRGGHHYAMVAAETAFKCREAAAQLFNVDDPEKVVFTFNATHGLNMAIKSLAVHGDKVMISGYEHNSVTRPLYEIGANVHVVRSALFEPEDAVIKFKEALTSDTKLVVWNHVSNVFGFIQPIEEIAEICHERGIPIIIDASQSAGNIKIDFDKLKADFIAMPGHKGLYGPQGTGILLCNKVPKAILSGGTGSNSASREMPDFLPDAGEAGTHNMPGVAGLLEGIKFVSKYGTENILAHERKLIRMLGNGLEKIDGVKVYIPNSNNCISGVLSLNIEGVPAERVGELLGEHGIAVRAGLHCSPEAHISAGTLEIGTVRASVSVFNDQKDIRNFVNSISEIARTKR